MPKKHMIFYGPGTTPNIVVDEDKAINMLEKVRNGDTIDEDLEDGEHIFIRGEDCWGVHSKTWTGTGRRKEDKEDKS